MHHDLSEIAVMSRRISPERLGPYASAAGGSGSAALDLYVWNAEMSAVLSVTIGHVEVILRNAIHQNLTAWSAQRFAEPRWYRDPGQVLQPRQAEAVRVARRRATREGRQPETPGRVVAELSFGFWRFLLANHYDATLWRQTLHLAFPGQARRRVIRDAVEVLNLSRNRLAHHEPMFNRPVADIRATALELTGWICPDGLNWYLMGSDGAMLTGLQRVDGRWYLLNTTPGATYGAMLHGWWKINDKFYYFNQLHDGTFGAMLTNTTTPDGLHVGADGAWLGY